MIKSLKNNFYMIRFVMRFAPEMLFFKILISLLNTGGNIAINIFLLQRIVDSMQYGGDFKEVLIFILMIGLALIGTCFINSIFNQKIAPKCYQKIHRGMHNMIFKRVRYVDLEKFDDAEFYNEYIWALNEADNCTNQSFNIVVSFFTNIITAALYTGISFALDPMLFVFAVVPIVCNVLISNLESKINVKKREEIVPVERRGSYSQRILYLQQYAKELRLYPSMNTKIIDEFNSSVAETEKIIDKYSARLSVMQFLRDLTPNLFGFLLVSLYISYRVIVTGNLSAGIFVAMVNSVNNFTWYIGSIFNAIPQLTQNGLYAEKVMNILNYKSTIHNESSSDEANAAEAEKLRNMFESIEFENVSFKYPHAEDYVIKNLSLKITNKEKIALVGINGAGKTTIIKLLLRLYDPTEGRILINGCDIRTLDAEVYRALFQVVFQDFQLYSFSVAENIMMRDYTDSDNSTIDTALIKSQLPDFRDKKDISITKEFDNDGILPSGGQSQKLAVARAFAHGGAFMIMDEASSALDPISEYNINKSIIENARDKSMVIVSHRLSTVQYADRIYYLEGGTVAEQGTHSELINARGKYAEMYELQAESYRI